MNTAIDMPNVTLTSAVGTILRYSIPTRLPVNGSQSTGIRSMRFIRNNQTKIVRASGAISLLLPWKVSRTLESTKSTRISMAACSLPGVPEVAFFATRPNSHTKTTPSTSEKIIESTFTVIAVLAQSFQIHCPSTRQTCRFCRWCSMYSPEVCGPCSLAIPLVVRSVTTAAPDEAREGRELRADEAREQRAGREWPHADEDCAEHDRRQRHLPQLPDVCRPHQPGRSRIAAGQRQPECQEGIRDDRSQAAQQRRVA